MMTTRSLRDVGRWIVEALRAVVILRVYQVIAVTMILAFGGSWVWSNIQAGVERDAELMNYQTGLEVFATQRQQRDTCLSGVETRDAYRARFVSSAETKRAFVDTLVDAFGADQDNPYVVRSYELVDAELAQIETDLPPRLVEDCPPEPVPPASPAGITPLEEP